ncbi:MAG TPA: FHA domain-containing protein [Anaerolineae bacterium]|nr:FHA domain-containing protein [Anaerolineae bacterium]
MSDSTHKPVPYLTDPTGREHLLNGKTTTRGRALENDIVITSKRISREHAHLQRDAGVWFWKTWRALTALSSTTSAYWGLALCMMATASKSATWR